MLSAFNLSDPLNLIALFLGVILLVKRVAEMDRYHDLRVFVLTTILSCVVIYFFLVYGFTLGIPFEPFDCIDEEHFCQSEM